MNTRTLVLFFAMSFATQAFADSVECTLMVNGSSRRATKPMRADGGVALHVGDLKNSGYECSTRIDRANGESILQIEIVKTLPGGKEKRVSQAESYAGDCGKTPNISTESTDTNGTNLACKCEVIQQSPKTAGSAQRPANSAR